MLESLCMRHIVNAVEHLLSRHNKKHKSTVSGTRAACACGILRSTDLAVHQPDPYRIAEEIWSVIDYNQVFVDFYSILYV